MTTFAARPSLQIANDTITALLISQDGTSGNATSAVLTVPTGKIWIIKTANAINADTGTARAVAIEITDGTNVVARIAGDLVSTIATGVQVRYVGNLLLPTGYQIRVNNVAVGAFVPVLQVTGLEFNSGLPSSVLNLV